MRACPNCGDSGAVEALETVSAAKPTEPSRFKWKCRWCRTIVTETFQRALCAWCRQPLYAPPKVLSNGQEVHDFCEADALAEPAARIEAGGNDRG